MQDGWVEQARRISCVVLETLPQYCSPWRLPHSARWRLILYLTSILRFWVWILYLLQELHFPHTDPHSPFAGYLRGGSGSPDIALAIAFSNWALSCILLKDARNQKSAFREWRVLYEDLYEVCEIWWSLICTSTVTSFKARHDEQPVNLRKWGRLHALKSYYDTDNENTLFEGSTIH